MISLHLMSTPCPKRSTSSYSLRRQGRRIRPCVASGTWTEQLDANLIASAKREILNLAGTKYGHDLSEEERTNVQSRIDGLSNLNIEPQTTNLTGTSWKLLYTSATGNSSGKIGPFVGEVTQEFPADRPGCYYNIVELSIFRADLEASWESVRPDRINVAFLSVTFTAGPLKFTKVFPTDSARGYWRMTYVDDDMRVFYTNKNNVFVLVRK